MKNQLQVFENEEFGKVRVLDIDGEPWFVGIDVTAILGYGNGSRDINRHVDEEDRQNYRNGTSEINNRGVTIINESGLYSLILSSKLPSAKKFKRWVTSEVLPSLRKHGAYITEETLSKILGSYEFTNTLLDTLAEEHSKNEVLRKALAEEKEESEALMCYVDLIHPKARYCDLVLQSEGLVQTTIIAKDYGVSAVVFNRLLHDLKIQYKIGQTWLLYQRLSCKGYTKTRTFYRSDGTSVIHTYWTQKGRMFLYETLKVIGILPEMEYEDPVAA